MCLICVEYEKEKLTISEARRNLEEMKENVGTNHYTEVKEMLLQEELEKSWERFCQGGYENNFDEDYWENTGFGD